MKREQRWREILELLGERGGLEIDETAQRLGVSEATARRDFDELARQHMLVRTRGGAMANGAAYALPMRLRAGRFQEEKRRIGQVVAETIDDCSVVCLNGGTTNLEVAVALAAHRAAQGDNARELTLVTNALNVAHELLARPQIKLVVTGGVARPHTGELIGPLAAAVVDGLSFDVMVLGVDGLSRRGGATTQSEDEAMLSRQLAARAGRLIVVADASKLGLNAFARICPLDEVTTIVTDARADERQLHDLRAAGTEVVLA